MVIGIMGLIGSGKTVVSHIMRDMGAYVVNADIKAREALLPDSPIIPQIRSVFGDEVFLCGNVINRKALAKVIFSDSEKRKKLDSITHPYIKKLMWHDADVAMRIYHRKLIVFDAPLLCEAGLDIGLDDIWLVTSDMEVRISRIISRDRTTRENAIARINARVSDDELRKKATVVIENNGSIADLTQQIKTIFKERYSL